MLEHRLELPEPDEPRARHTVHAPWDGAAIGSVELATPRDVEHVLGVQRSLFARRSRALPAHERARILRRAARCLSQEAEELALGIAGECGKPLVDARVEVSRALLGLEWTAGDLERLHGEEVPMHATASASGRLAFTVREPVGVVAAISAFNHPLNLAVHQVAPAVAAGCPVTLKPALETPFSALRLARALREAGLPEGWCVVLPCADEVAQHLAESPRLAALSFIGSAEVGWTLRRRVAEGVRVCLEHGGAAPVLVDASADLDHAAPLLLKGAYYHAGQVCVSVQRVFVHRTRLMELVDRLVEGARSLTVGDPREESTDVGPLIRERDVVRVLGVLGEAVAAGASLVTGGERVARQAVSPAVVVGAPDTTSLMQAEVFGPVLAVTAFDDWQEAIDRANGTRWAFQAAVFAEDLRRALSAVRGLDASTVVVNDHTAFRADWMPFGGRRASGLGVGGLPATLREYTQEKLIVLPG